MGIITLAIKHGDIVQEDVFQFTDDKIKAFAAELVADQAAEIARLQKELEEARKALTEINNSAMSYPQCGVTCGEIARAAISKIGRW